VADELDADNNLAAMIPITLTNENFRRDSRYIRQHFRELSYQEADGPHETR